MLLFVDFLGRSFVVQSECIQFHVYVDLHTNSVEFYEVWLCTTNPRVSFLVSEHGRFCGEQVGGCDPGRVCDERLVFLW